MIDKLETHNLELLTCMLEQYTPDVKVVNQYGEFLTVKYNEAENTLEFS